MRGDKLIIHDHHIRAATKILDLVRTAVERSPGAFAITIAGESGSGKSEVASALGDALTAAGHPAVILQQDDYFVYPPHTNAEMRKKDIGQVGLSEVHLDVLDKNVADILGGASSIEKPLVLFDEDRITQETLELGGAKAVIAEGTYTTTLEHAHCRVFLDLTYHQTKAARLERAREEQDTWLETILKIEHEIISGHKSRADIIITPDYDVRENDGKR